MTRQFERVANVVTERISELLCTRVLLLDDRGVVIAQSADSRNASSELSWVGFSFGLNSHGSKARTISPYLRLPIRFHGRCGEVIIAESDNGETISPSLTQKLVEMIVNQTTAICASSFRAAPLTQQRFAIAQMPKQHELKNKFIHDLLRGSITDEADILRQGQILGMDFTRKTQRSGKPPY